MAKDEKEGNGEEKKSTSLDKVAAGIDILYRIAKELAGKAVELRRRGIPDYSAAAKAFEEIAKRLRESFNKLLLFINKAIDTRSNHVDEAKLVQFLDEYRAAKVEDIVRDIKFKCAEIDSAYSQNVEAWVKKFLGLQNTFAKRIVATKGESADAILKQLTDIDGALMETLIKSVIVPLRDDYAIRIADSKLGKEERKRLHKEMQNQFRPVIKEVENGLRQLDDAVIAFGKLAGR